MVAQWRAIAYDGNACEAFFFSNATRSRICGDAGCRRQENVFQALTSGALMAGDIDSYALLGTPDEERCGGPNSFQNLGDATTDTDIRLRSRI